MNELISNEIMDDMPEITDFSKGRKNPFAEKIKKKGVTIREYKYYSPEDMSNGNYDCTKDVVHALIELMTVPESKKLLAYIKENYNLPCSDNVWDYLGEYR
jgi:uncharacterized protein YpmS